MMQLYLEPGTETEEEKEKDEDEEEEGKGTKEEEVELNLESHYRLLSSLEFAFGQNFTLVFLSFYFTFFLCIV